MAEFETVGHSVARLEGADKLAGRAVYVDDIVRPGMLHGAVLLSPYPHARIVRIDTSAARAAPGVRCVLTGEDFPRRFGGFVHDEVGYQLSSGLSAISSVFIGEFFQLQAA